MMSPRPYDNWNPEPVKVRVIEASELDQKGYLRPLLLFKGSQTEGRIRSLWNLIVSMMDADIPSITEAVKFGNKHDFAHMCGLHSQPAHHTFNSILGRIITRPDVASHVPNLLEYCRHLGASEGANPHLYLIPIPAIALGKTKRPWRLGEKPERRRSQAATGITELYPYISGAPSTEHELILAVDAAVPKGLPNAVRCDVCQDMLVAILSGETTLDNLRGETGRYLRQFWKMFPEKYGHISLDGIVPGTTDLRLIDTLDARRSRIG